MKNLSLSVLLLFAFVSAFAQNTIPNAGFENWTEGSADSWNSSFTVTFIMPIEYNAGVASSDAHAGDYAMSLVTQTISGFGQNIVLPGICQLGNFETDSIVSIVMSAAGNQNTEIDPARMVSGGVPFNTVPKNVKVWAKYIPDAMSTDAMQVVVLATKYNELTGSQVVARGTYKSMTALDEYTEISIPLTVEMEGETPDFLNIIFASAGSYNCGNSELLVDDISVETETGICNVNSFSFSVMPNPTSDFINVQMDNNDAFTCELYDLNGKKVKETGNCVNAANICVSDLAAGSYIVKIIQKNGVSAKKIVVE